jgi:hypothetical protein
MEDQPADWKDALDCAYAARDRAVRELEEEEARRRQS